MGGGAIKKEKEESDRDTGRKKINVIFGKERGRTKERQMDSAGEKGGGYATQNEERKQCVSNSVIRRKSRYRTVNGHFLNHQERV